LIVMPLKKGKMQLPVAEKASKITAVRNEYVVIPKELFGGKFALWFNNEEKKLVWWGRPLHGPAVQSPRPSPR